MGGCGVHAVQHELGLAPLFFSCCRSRLYSGELLTFKMHGTRRYKEISVFCGL